MANQRVLPLRARFGELISEAREKKSEDIDAVKKKRLEEADSLAKYALPKKNQECSARISECLQNAASGDKKPLPNIRPGCTKPGPGENVPLPTPPRSPVTSNSPTRASIDAKPVVEILNFEDIADIRTSLCNHKAEIASLRLQLENINVEVQDLYKQCRKASEEEAKAICQGDEENAEKSAKLEKNLQKLLEQKNETIDELRGEIVERKGREGELREKLAEAEGRYKVREATSRGKDEAVYDGSSLGNRRTSGKGRPDWEIRRKRGKGTTSVTAACQVLQGTRRG